MFSENTIVNKKEMLSLKAYLKKYRMILVFAVLVALGAGFFAWRTGQNYSVSLVLTIARQASQPATDYQYDSYYAIKAADEFGDTVSSWFKTPEIASAIDQQAGLGAGGSLNALSRKFNAAKISPNLVEVRYAVATPEEAKRVVQAINQVIGAKISQINASAGQKNGFMLSSGEPVVAQNTFNLLLNILAGFLIGLVFGFFIQVAKEYFIS